MRQQQRLQLFLAVMRRYVESRDDQALAELIARHATIVRGVCRRLLGDTPDADDAFQATFLVLIRSGDRVRRPQSLAAWLYGVAHRIARRQLRQQSKANRPLQTDVAAIDGDPLTHLATRHDVSVLDAELARLPEKYRAPIVLHHLEGKSHREVAAEMQLTEGAVDGLLKRGRNELRIRLVRRGVVFGVTMAALQSMQSTLTAASSQAVVDATIQNLLTLDPVLHPEFPKLPAARLAHQELSTMLLSQSTKVAACTLVASLFVGVAGIGISTARHDVALNAAGLLGAELRTAAADPDAVVSAAENDAEESNPEAAEPASEFEPQPPADFREGKLSDHPILKKLDERTEISFVDTSLRDALDYWSQLHGFNISVDEAKIKEDGASLDHSVNLELSGVTLRSGLKLMLDAVRLDYIIEDDVMKITSQKAAENFREMRIYELNAAWQNKESAERLEALVKDTAGGKWQAPGTPDAGGTVQWTPQGLAVRHNQRTHLAIERLLAKLDAPQPATKSVTDVLDEVTQIEADDIPLRDVLNQLSARHKLPIRIDGITIGGRGLSKMPDQRVNFTAQDATLKEVLHVFLEPLALDYVIENDGIRITSAEEARRIHGGRHENRIVNRSHAGESIAIVGDIDLDGDGNSDRQMFYELLKAAGIKLSDVIDDAGKRAGEKLGEETKFLVIGGIPDFRLKANRTERDQAQNVARQLIELRKEARLNGVRIVGLNDFLEYIGQPKANPIPEPTQTPVIDFRRRRPSEVRIEAALGESTEIGFVDTSLRQALEFIEDLHNIQIVIKQAEITADGGSIDQPVSLKLSGATLESALDLMLEPMELDYIVDKEVLLITTKNKASEHHELRVYNLADFEAAFGKIDFEDDASVKRIVQAIKTAVPREWVDVEGIGGTMSLTPAGLIVRQSQRTHREIRDLIDQLRRANEAKYDPALR